MAPKLRFTEGEKVLCFHGPLLYEAKCIKNQIKDKQVKYFIHYSGWNKNWDEWVPESRVLKYNDANLQKQKELEKTHVKTKKAKTGKITTKKDPAEKERAPTPSQEKPIKQKAAPAPVLPSTTETPAEAQRKKRTRAEQNVETEDDYIQKLEIKVKIPDELKIWLVDDWDLVTRQKKLVHLPARVTVEHILGDYVKQKVSVKGMTVNKETAVTEVTNGIREYFNVMLGKQLLYKFERPQYAEILAEYPDKQMSEIYGAIHLLRLFAKIGGVLAYTPLDDESVNLLMNHLQDFTKYMAKTTTLFSLSDYIVASPEYHRKAV